MHKITQIRKQNVSSKMVFTTGATGNFRERERLEGLEGGMEGL